VRRHVHRPPLKLRPGQRRWLYVSGLALLLSGTGWLSTHYSLEGPSEFPGAPHPSEIWWLRVHGAAAMGFLVAFGTVLTHHVRSGWRQHLNRTSGVANLVVVGVLALSAYGLYYVGDDHARSLISKIHWVMGLIGAGALMLHVTLGQQLTANRDGTRH